MRALGAVALLLLATTFAGAAQRVSFRADDGTTLAATWYEPSSRPAPAVIFVHMLHRSRRDWDQIASRLASEGVGALAIDLRGHGDSGGSLPLPDGFAAFVQDVKAARRYLAGRPDVQQGRIGMAGASLGANVAALHAATDPSVGSLALLSPTLDYRGLRIADALKKFTRPALLVASDDDSYALRSARELQKGPALRELVVLNRAGHGTVMLGRDADLPRRLVDWLRRTL